MINCREDVTAQVALTNRAASAVAATGVRRTTRVVSGGCGNTPDFVYARTPQLAGAGRTTVVMDEPLYIGGSGCCTRGSFCDGRTTCAIEQGFTALTTPGSVAAGSFTYQVNFLNCGECSQVSAAGRSAPLATPR